MPNGLNVPMRNTAAEMTQVPIGLPVATCDIPFSPPPMAKQVKDVAAHVVAESFVQEQAYAARLARTPPP